LKHHIKTGVLVENSILLANDKNVHSGDYQNSWVAEAYGEFSSIVGRENFPCLFGRSALKRYSMKFLFVSQNNHNKNLLAGLLAYTKFVRETSLHDRLYSPLIVIFEKKRFSLS